MATTAETLAYHLNLKNYRVYFSGRHYIKVLPPKACQLTAKQMQVECRHRIFEAGVVNNLKWGRGKYQQQAKLFQMTYGANPLKPQFEVVGPNVIDIAIDKATKNKVQIEHGGAAAAIASGSAQHASSQKQFQSGLVLWGGYAMWDGAMKHLAMPYNALWPLGFL